MSTDASPEETAGFGEEQAAEEDLLPEEIREAEQEARDLELRLERITADFESFRRRQAREAEDAVRFANERVLKELLPVLDNFDRAERAVEAAAAGDAQAARLVESLRAVARQIDEVLGRIGVTPFSTLGQPFDPQKAEAVGMREDAAVPPQTVVEEYQRGYMLHDRLLRPAVVVVSAD